jgi:hypothetical protein
MTYLAQAYIKKIEGAKKSKDSEVKVQASEQAFEKFSKQNGESLTPSFSETPSRPYKTVRQKRKALSLTIRRAVFEKAQHCCEYTHPLTGKRCGSEFQLQIDHVRPLACGGSDEIKNLRALRGLCNRREAQRWGLQRPTEN